MSANAEHIGSMSVDAFALSEARRFPRACVATPHHLASAAGLAVLADGGNAVDAVVAANLTLGVVAPYLCGYGGDLFVLLWREGDADGDGFWAYNGSGRAPAAATRDAVRVAAGSDAMPAAGPLTVTVPGAVEGWFVLLEGFGTRSFGELARSAVAYAEDGFVLSGRGAGAIARSKARFGRGASDWWDVYGGAEPGRPLRQPALARAIRTLADDGPDAFYGGTIGRDIAAHVQAHGGLMEPEDIAEHRGEPMTPMRAWYRDVEVLELPPNTQGVTALEALRIVEALSPGRPSGDGDDGGGGGYADRDRAEREHLAIEAMKLALADRDTFLTDPEAMTIAAEDLLAPAFVAARASAFDGARAGQPALGRPAQGGTAYLCAADAEGIMVSLIQSNYMGFGSGVTVPTWGINLQNRGAYFSLDPWHANVIAPRKRTLHTLVPAMALKDGAPWMAFGAMGGDGQAQTHLQLMVRMVDDSYELQRAIDAPRWVVSPYDHGVLADERFGPGVVEALRAKGHRVTVAPWFDPAFGHAHAIAREAGVYAGATDPRTEGAVLGL
jgi:gamma-glutamyltranspeptidase/glutathione hydrolase